MVCVNSWVSSRLIMAHSSWLPTSVVNYGVIYKFNLKFTPQIQFPDDFKGLFWFREHIAKTQRFTGIVLYTGRQTVPFGDGMKAVPVSALWESEGD